MKFGQIVKNGLMYHMKTAECLRLKISDADPDLWIRICIIKVGSVWRDTNPDSGHMEQ